MALPNHHMILMFAPQGPNLVIHHSDDVLATMNEWCIEHHGESGAHTVMLLYALQISHESVREWMCQCLGMRPVFLPTFCELSLSGRRPHAESTGEHAEHEGCGGSGVDRQSIFCCSSNRVTLPRFAKVCERVASSLQVLEFIKKYTTSQCCHIAGNTVHCDLAFIRVRHVCTLARPKTIDSLPSQRDLCLGLITPVEFFFAQKYMPRIAEHLHYRIVDISSIYEIARRWYPKACSPCSGGTSLLRELRLRLSFLKHMCSIDSQSLQELQRKPRKKCEHLALPDIRDSIEELRWFRKHIFKEAKKK